VKFLGLKFKISPEFIRLKKGEEILSPENDIYNLLENNIEINLSLVI
jgi:hypothetical protein